MASSFGNTGLQQAASRATGESSLYTAKIPSAYAATWQYQYAQTLATAYVLPVVGGGSGVWDVDVLGNGTVLANTQSLLLFTQGTNSEMGFGNSLPQPDFSNGGPVRVKFTVSIDGAETGTVTLYVAGVVTASVASGSVDEVILFPVDANISFVAVGYPADAVISISYLFEQFPPAIRDIEYALNPAIPYHRLVLAIPGDEFSCLARVEFTLGGSVQSALEVAVGTVNGMFVINPPVSEFFAPYRDGRDNGDVKRVVDSRGAVYDLSPEAGGEPKDLTSQNVACLEWTSLADKVRVSFSNFSAGTGNGIAFGILSMPPGGG